MPDVEWDPPYPVWRNKPTNSTPWNAAAGNRYNDGIQKAIDQANLALSTAEAGGGEGAVVTDNGDGTVTVGGIALSKPLDDTHVKALLLTVLASLKVKIVLDANTDGTWPNRPNYPYTVIFKGPNAPTIRTDGVTTGGTPQMTYTTAWSDEWDHTP